MSGNKRKKAGSRKVAVALQYELGERAPKVLASGAGELAKRILELAEKNKVPVHQDSSLAEILSKVAVGQEIPPETYQVVAEILAFLYRTDSEWRKRKLAK